MKLRNNTAMTNTYCRNIMVHMSLTFQLSINQMRTVETLERSVFHVSHSGVKSLNRGIPGTERFAFQPFQAYFVPK